MSQAEARIEWEDPERISASVVRAVMTAAVDVVAQEARRRVPRKTGGLAEHIVTRVERTRDSYAGSVRAQARHAYLVHEGSAPHRIEPRARRRKGGAAARALAIPTGAGVVLRRSAEHPGAQGQPYLTDALEASRAQIAAMIATAGATLKEVR